MSHASQFQPHHKIIAFEFSGVELLSSSNAAHLEQAQRIADDLGRVPETPTVDPRLHKIFEIPAGEDGDVFVMIVSCQELLNGPFSYRRFAIVANPLLRLPLRLFGAADSKVDFTLTRF